jgi:hypothetical protein
VADDLVSSALAPIRERMMEADFLSPALCAVIGMQDAPLLLSAVEAVLKLADDAVPVDRDYGGEPIWWDLTPDGIRAAVLSALTGKEAGGA